MPVHGSVIPQHLIPKYEHEASQNQVVYKDIEAHLSDIDEEEKLSRHKICITIFTWVLVLIGAFLILFGTASTNIFASQKKILGLFIFGIILELPFICWCYMMFCPHRDERDRRKVISKKRKARLKAIDHTIRREQHEMVIIEEEKRHDAELKALNERMKN